MLIHNKDDIEFVTEFPCFLGHPVDKDTYLEILCSGGKTWSWFRSLVNARRIKKTWF